MTQAHATKPKKCYSPSARTVAALISAGNAASQGKTVLFICANSRRRRERLKDCNLILRTFGYEFAYKKTPDYVRVAPGGGRVWFVSDESQIQNHDIDMTIHDIIKNPMRHKKRRDGKRFMPYRRIEVIQ